ncbi:MAG: hypothetical protein IT303_09370 [Dehalococcoidia bacterium]|nr:hypothetical protein [Dehalococcoidia bacterium]
MSVFTATRARRRVSLIGLGVAGAAIMFGTGALVAGAVSDDEEPSSPSVTIPISNVSRDDGGVASNTPSVNAVPPKQDADGGRGGAMTTYPAGCAAPIGDVVGAGVIDPAKAGFVMNVPASGYTLTGVNLHAVGKCDDTGNATSGDLALDTTWKHTESGLDVYISQVKSSIRASNVRWETSATFASNGYNYSVAVNGYRIYPAGTIVDDAPDSASGSGSASSPAIAPGEPYPGSEIDPRAAAVLEDLVAKLAPELAGGKCFYTETQGTWADLVAAGIGDPRSAIPSGFAESSTNFRTFVAPSSCDAGPAPAQGGYEATFERANPFGFFYISVYPLGEGSEPYPGNLNEYGANWANAKWQFNIGAKSEQGMGIDVISAIARALDPGFANACLATNVPLTEADILAMGLKSPAADGYTTKFGPASKTELTGNCTPAQRAMYTGNEQAAWTLTDTEGSTIDVRAYRYGAGATSSPGYIGQGSANWQGPNNWRIEIYGWNRTTGNPVDRDMLIEVATSIDPGLDVSKLQDGGDVKPLPVEERSAR